MFVCVCLNQSINEDLTSGSSPEGDVRDVTRGICSYKLFKPPEHTCKNINRRESEKQGRSIAQGRQVCTSRAKVGRGVF